MLTMMSSPFANKQDLHIRVFFYAFVIVKYRIWNVVESHFNFTFR